MKTIIYTRVSTVNQDYKRQIESLKQIAESKSWVAKRVFAEKISGTTSSKSRTEFSEMLRYIDKNEIEVVMISEISRLGRKVLDVLNAVDALHKKGIALYVQQFDMLSLQNGTENPTVKLLLQMMSIGAEMENDLRRTRQKEGIQLAKMNYPEVYSGRKVGAKADKEKQLEKYSDVVKLLDSSSLSLREISRISGRSVNTVRKVKQMIG